MIKCCKFVVVMKKIIILALVLLAMRPIAGGAQETSYTDEEMMDTVYFTLMELITPQKPWKHSDVASIPKFGGYVIGYYKANAQEGDRGGEGFGLRLARVYVDGTILKDFKYRMQMELNDKPHIKDAFIAWSHWKELEIKIGQFKRCFTFENPYHPWDVGFGDYSQLTKKFTGFGDRCGEASTGGRDLGLQVQGDAFPSKHDGHRQLHYAAAFFNGNGINQRDNNHMKDFICNLQWSPIRDLWIGAFGWNGSWTGGDYMRTVNRKRLGFGVKYEGSKNRWSARGEYVRSSGHKISDYQMDANNLPYWAGTSKADAWYLTVGAPVWKWIKCYLKYDVYRDYATRASMHTIYTICADLEPHKNLKLQVQYNFHNDHTSADRRYSQFWVETYVRF